MLADYGVLTSETNVVLRKNDAGVQEIHTPEGEFYEPKLGDLVGNGKTGLDGIWNEVTEVNEETKTVSLRLVIPDYISPEAMEFLEAGSINRHNRGR